MTQMRKVALAILMLVSCITTAYVAGEAAPTSGAQRRVALVLGNAAYENVPALTNPVEDAKAIAKELEALNFEVISGFDLSKLETQETIARFAKAVRGADIALLFYAGHGMQVSGNNYLLPVDAALEDETSLDFESVQVNFILRQMSRETQTRLVFLDACRDNPLAKAFGESIGLSDVSSGLAEIQIDKGGKGTLIAFATSPNEVAYDGAGNHSPFSAALLAHLGEPNVSLTAAMTKVTADVVKATDGRQRPWVNLSLTDDIILNAIVPAQAAQSAAVAAADPDSAKAPLGDRASDQVATSEIPELLTKGPITFDMPIMFGDKALDGKSISQLIQGKPLFPPIEGLDKAVWFNQCTNCHHWNQERLCEQAKNYIKPTKYVLRIQHPLGTRFKVALGKWADNGCATSRTDVAAAAVDPISSTSRAAGGGADNPDAGRIAVAQIPELVTQGPITFDMPILFGDRALDGKSISQLIQGKPLFPPIEGLEKALWFNQCTNCHHWTKERLCEQAKNYDKPSDYILRIKHPLGTRFKVALGRWAHDGCN